MNCDFSLNCKLKNSGYCSESCERFTKLNYLFTNSLVPSNLIMPKSLYIDADGSDKQIFTYLKSVQKNIKTIIISTIMIIISYKIHESLLTLTVKSFSCNHIIYHNLAKLKVERILPYPVIILCHPECWS